MLAQIFGFVILSFILVVMYGIKFKHKSEVLPILGALVCTLLSSPPLKTIFQHRACIDKLYTDSFYKVQKNSHSSFEVICCCR